MKNRRLMVFALAGASLMASCAPAPSDSSSSSSEESTYAPVDPFVPVTDPAYPLALLEQRLKDRYENDSFGLSFSDRTTEEPLIALTFDGGSLLATDSSSGASEEVTYSLSLSADSFLAALNGRTDASSFHVSFGSDRLDCLLKDADETLEMPFSQGLYMHLAKEESRDFGAYIDLSKSALTRALLETAADKTLPERIYKSLPFSYDSLSFPLDLSSLPNFFCSYLQDEIDDAKASLSQDETRSLYRLSYQNADLLSSRDELIAKISEYSALSSVADSLEDSLDGLKSLSLAMDYVFDEEGPQSLDLSFDAAFAEGSSLSLDALSFRGQGIFLEGADALCPLPDDLASFEETSSSD